MGIETQEKVIGNHTFRVTQLPASKARKLLTRLFKVAGPSMAKAVEGLGTILEKKLKQPSAKGKKEGEGITINLADLDLSKLSDAVALLAKNVFEEDFEYVVAVLLEGDRISYSEEGKWPVLDLQASDAVFAGKLDQMFMLIGFALEVNFSGFFGGSGLASVISRVGGTANPEQSQSSSPPS